MPGHRLPHDLPALLEELRRIAQNGLVYADNPYDRERYGRLMEIACAEYGALAGLSSEEVRERFASELGHVTPKVGVDAAVADEQGRLLLVRRADDGRWAPPGGWAELGESARESVEREVLEETGLVVGARGVIEVLPRLPGEWGTPHTSCHILFHCVATGGSLRTSVETLEVGFFHPAEITEWHRDADRRAAAALRYLERPPPEPGWTK